MGESIVSGMVEGGKATTGPPFGPALGPFGVNISGIVDEINKKTADYSGIKIPVKVFVNTETKAFRVEVGSPTTSALIMKELGVQLGAKTKEETIGNLTMEQVKKIANAKGEKIYGNTLADKVKQVLGTCNSMGVTCDGEKPTAIIEKIGKKEISVE
ncbi:MAG: 50S ribosomal protein L11 [Candidatus Marsarchaeota archaeon]|jgi:large subunit ribosomal protein L11|nr:50S ribosomal protein L11 [Candidatus Marsarchaeota archaeon]